MTRVCARPGCRETATAMFVYDYQARPTWPDPLADDRHLMTYDPCPAHSDALTVPHGWLLVDRRGSRAHDDALAS